MPTMKAAGSSLLEPQPEPSRACCSPGTRRQQLCRKHTFHLAVPGSPHLCCSPTLQQCCQASIQCCGSSPRISSSGKFLAIIARISSLLSTCSFPVFTYSVYAEPMGHFHLLTAKRLFFFFLISLYSGKFHMIILQLSNSFVCLFY